MSVQKYVLWQGDYPVVLGTNEEVLFHKDILTAVCPNDDISICEAYKCGCDRFYATVVDAGNCPCLFSQNMYDLDDM